MLLALVMCLSLTPTVSFADNGNTGAGGSQIGSVAGGPVAYSNFEAAGETSSGSSSSIQGVR